MKTTSVLKGLLNKGELIIAPGVFDGLSARLVAQAGFRAIYASGGAIARSSGYPDLGLLSVDEVATRLATIVDVTDIPVIADADTGFGNALNVHRTVKTFERLGIAALHLEDQVFPKRCGHLDNKELVSCDEMVQKIKVAKDALEDPDFTLIARTDAIAVEGFEPAIERAQQYVAAGADVIFVEAPQTIEQIEAIANAISQPKLINMFYGGKTPLVPAKQLAEWGYQIVIIPSDLQRACIRAIQDTLAVIKKDGDSKAVANQIATFKEREEIIDTASYLELADIWLS
jgi:2-methylisocitrate lyase-like PEP mutase family enzyme